MKCQPVAEARRILREAGGYDGEKFSNTLYFEREHGWSGLLVEADPKNFALLSGKHRKAWSAEACLSLNLSVQTQVPYLSPLYS